MDTLNVTYKSFVYSFPLSLSTVAVLKQQLQERTGIPTHHQKLLCKGKILQDDQTLSLLPHSKVILMGSQPHQLKEAATLEKRLQERLTLAPKLGNKTLKRRPVADKYTFQALSVLPHFPQPDKARQLLERLRDDSGIKAIMCTRQWSVGELTELSPFEATLLGYNRNKGQLIAIRLRTDDLTGFRHYDSVRKVLLHELTHNVWSDHDHRFHALNRELNRAIALDWGTHHGHRMTGEDYYQPLEEDTDTGLQGGSFVLGGASHPLDRDTLANAAVGRLTKEEQDMDRQCDS
ncbi:WLM domain-containing protein [Spinellus fusiger]|nr:WLM domain-containing protein [Spinellus fusiger]